MTNVESKHERITKHGSLHSDLHMIHLMFCILFFSRKEDVCQVEFSLQDQIDGLCGEDLLQSVLQIVNEDHLLDWNNTGPRGPIKVYFFQILPLHLLILNKSYFSNQGRLFRGGSLFLAPGLVQGSPRRQIFFE